MEKYKVGILEADNFSGEAIRRLEKHFVVEIYEQGDIENFLADKYAIFVRLQYKINNEILKNANGLKYICSPTTGLNHIVTDKNIEILSLKGEKEFLKTIRATPEHSFGLALSLLRNYKYAYRTLENSEWNRDAYRGEEIFNSKVGIIGMGRVGNLLSQYYSSFGAKVSYYDIDKEIDCDNKVIRCSSIEELIGKNVIIHMCASYSEAYKHFFDEKYLSMLDNKYFINTARGELIEENDLIYYIKNGKYKGIAIDVLCNEAEKGFDCSDIVRAAEGKNVIITPHIAGATVTSMHRTEEYIVDKLLKMQCN